MSMKVTARKIQSSLVVSHTRPSHPSSNESSSSSSPISSRERSPENSDYTHVHWVTSSDKSGRPTKRQCGEGAVLHELQDLESFFGLRNTNIGGEGNTAVGGKAYSECCSCCYTTKCSSCNVANSSESTGTTARLICECPECRNSKDYKPSSRSSSTSSSSSSSPSLVRTSLLVKPWSSPSCPCVEDYIRYSTNPSHSMVSVPSIHGSTANAMPAMPLESPCNKSCDQYVTAPNGVTSTASGPREDSRSGGRDYRRPTVRDICGHSALKLASPIDCVKHWMTIAPALQSSEQVHVEAFRYLTAPHLLLYSIIEVRFFLKRCSDTSTFITFQ
ncbi:hypothetical protein COOONC_10075 [Cooperia oncophora]